LPRIDVSLCVILDGDVEATLPLEAFTREVIRGGATCLQVRAKHATARNALDLARRVLAVAIPLGVPVIVNDRLDLALASGAAGVHLGEEDLPVSEARRLAGPGLVIGASATTLDAARRAAEEGADYLGVGPVFATPTKPEAAPIARGVLEAISREISLPIVAIGGINESNLAIPIREGADGIAVISALRQCPSPGEVAARLKTAIAKAKKG
jgi:thiamine-phosphate pyrophosphorylase